MEKSALSRQFASHRSCRLRRFGPTLMRFASGPTNKLSPGALADANGRKVMIKSGLFILGLGFAATAMAQPRETQPQLRSEAVTYADLKVGSAAGQAILRERIKAAAGRVCELGGMATMEEFHEATACYRNSYRDGLNQMDKLVAAVSTGSFVAASALVITTK